MFCLYGFERDSFAPRWAVEVFVTVREVDDLLGTPTFDGGSLRSWAVAEEDARLLFAHSSSEDERLPPGLGWSLAWGP